MKISDVDQTNPKPADADPNLDIDPEGFRALETVEAELERRRLMGLALNVRNAGGSDPLFDRD